MRHVIMPIGMAIAFVALMAVAAITRPANAHDFYTDWKQPGTNASCCDNRDCRPTQAYRDDDGVWRARLDGAWVRVPADRVLGITAPDGNSHICANEAGMILCFVGGVPKI